MCLLTVVPGDRATGEALSGASAADGIGATGLRCEPRIPALPLLPMSRGQVTSLVRVSFSLSPEQE